MRRAKDWEASMDKIVEDNVTSKISWKWLQLMILMMITTVDFDYDFNDDDFGDDVNQVRGTRG